MNKVQQLLQALEEGPATSNDLAVELGWSTAHVCVRLSDLHRRRLVQRTQDKRKLRHRSPGAWIYSR